MVTREYRKRYYKDHKQQHDADMKRRYNERKAKCIRHYGGKCGCCGETETAFLTIDRIDGGGRKHRRSIGNVYLWLIRNDFPDGFQVLCWNCNCGKLSNGGVCPHQKDKHEHTRRFQECGTTAKEQETRE